MENALINMNGRLCNEHDAKVSVFDRSFLYGDSLYEVIRTYNKKPYGMSEHLERLQQSALLCHMKFTQTPETLHSEIQKTLDAFFKQNPKAAEAYIRIIISRGVGKIGFGPENVTSGTQMIIIALPLEEPSTEIRQKGIRLKIVERLRNHPKALNPAMKSGNYLNCLLAFLEAKDEGFDDAVLLNQEGYVTEGTTFNIFAIRGSTLLTSPLEIGILAGITRAKILKIAPDLDLKPVEKNFTAEELLNSDEVFITGTVKEVLGVSKLNSRSYSVGPKTLALYDRFREIIAHE